MTASRLPGRVRTPLLVVLLLLVSLPAVTSRLNASDEIEYYAWLRSWAFDRDADFDNEYTHFADITPGLERGGFRATFLDQVNEHGRRPNFAPVGTALLWSPFFAVGHAAAVLTGAPQDGYSAPYIRAVTLGSAAYGWLALLLSGAVAARVVGRRPGRELLAVWLGTPLIFYMLVAPGFSHACSAFAVTLFLWVWLRVRETWSWPGMVALGVCGALLPMVREQDVFFLAGPALDFLRTAWRRRADLTVARTLVPGALAGTVAGVMAYSPQLLAYLALNGHPSPTTYVARKMNWLSPHGLSVVFSPEHGLLAWTPLLVPALAGLVALVLRRRQPPQGHPDVRWIAGLALLMVALQAYVGGAVESWTVAGSFGQRRFVSITPVLVVGLTGLMALSATRTRRAVWTGVLAVAVWWNIGLMAQFGLHLMDRQRLTLAANARMTFIELPTALPRIGWRYLMDRESFYGLPRE